jgi:hypothetical protein
MFFKFSEGYVGAGMKENPQVFAELKSRVEKEAEILAPLIKAHEIEVRELSARTERDAQRSEWETRRQEAQVRKTALFAQAESTFRSKHYAAAADLFRQILQDIDPDDIQARCFYYLNLMHLQYDFLERSGADYTKIGRGNVLNKRHLILRGARRFWQRILAMRFLIRNQEKVPALTNVPAVRAIDPYMASLIGGGTDFRVFSGTGEARVAAGLEFNPELLENKIKLEIDREARRFLSAADVSNHKDNADQIPQLVTQGVGVD